MRMETPESGAKIQVNTRMYFYLGESDATGVGGRCVE